MAERPDIRLTADEQAVFLRVHRKAALATIDKNGFPHVTAMNFVMHEGAFYMTSYGKAQKVVNIRRNPKVAIMAEAGAARPGREHRGRGGGAPGVRLVRRSARRELQAAGRRFEQRAEAGGPQTRAADDHQL